MAQVTAQLECMYHPQLGFHVLSQPLPQLQEEQGPRPQGLPRSHIYTNADPGKQGPQRFAPE